MNKRNLINYILLFLSAFFWGSSFVFTKELLHSFQPISILFFRLLIATIVFLIIVTFFFRKQLKINKKDIKTLIIFSCFEPVLYFLFETYSLQYCDASIVSIIIATIPMFVSFLSIYYFKENFTKFNLIGAFVAFVGIFVMLFPLFKQSSLHIGGIFLAFAAVFSAVGYNFYLRKLPKNYHPVVVITYQNIIGLAIFTPLFFIFNSKDSISLQFVALTNPQNLSYLLILAICCSALAFMFFLHGIRHFGVGKTNIFTNLIPAITALLSYFIIGENLTINKWIGIFIVIIGICLVQKQNFNIKTHSN